MPKVARRTESRKGYNVEEKGGERGGDPRVTREIMHSPIQDQIQTLCFIMTAVLFVKIFLTISRVNY